MGIWIEIRCENRNNRSAISATGKCEEGTGDMAAAYDQETQGGIMLTLSGLMELATREGWKRSAYGWVCRHCAAQAAAMDEMAAQKAKVGMLGYNERHYRDR